MNFNRRNRYEDVLFVIALLVPAVLSGARYIESDRQITQIAQAKSQAAMLAAEKSRAPAPVVVARAEPRGG